MPVNPTLSVLVAGYVPPATKRRMQQIFKRNQRLTLSKQLAECVEAHLPKIEARLRAKPQDSDSDHASV